jgi:hypothetical protein
LALACRIEPLPSLPSEAQEGSFPVIFRKKSVIAMAAAALPFASIASAQVDTLQEVVSEVNAVGGVPIVPPLGTFGYDPVNDRMYVAGFSNGDQELRRIDNVSGTQTVTTLITATQWLRFNRDNDLNLGGGTPIPSSLLLNPQPVGSEPAYSFAWITDAASVVTEGTPPVRRPDVSQRLYTFNLQQSTQPNASDVLTSRVTLANLHTAVGAASTENTNIGRQGAYSGDGQSLYFIDTNSGAASLGGLWKVPAAGGAPVRLLGPTADLNTEPAVLSSGGVDTIYFRGGGSTGNEGGIDKVTHDGTNTGARTVHVAAAAINEFLENTGTASITNLSMASDASGNLYFNNTSTTGGLDRAIFRLDSQGRLSKVVGYEERKVVFGPQAAGGNPNSNTFRMQPRTTTFGTGTSAFQVTQILYAEQGGVNAVAGAYVFKVGDFDRDNDVDQTDIGLFKNNLTLRGVTLAATNPGDHGKFRYDLNGNNEVTWKDVKILQQFYGFFDGDADINKTVNINDFSTLAANFNLSGKKWTEGDFTGDEIVNIQDFSALAANFNLTAPADGARAHAVPEPTTLAGLIAAASAMMLRRRHR